MQGLAVACGLKLDVYQKERDIDKSPQNQNVESDIKTNEIPLPNTLHVDKKFIFVI